MINHPETPCLETAAPTLRATDEQSSIAAGEFVWNQAGATHVHELILPPLLRWLKQCGARTVLDLGCGNGWLTSLLAQSGFEAVGADVSESGLRLARAHYPEVDFFQVDIGEPLPEALAREMDAVIAIEVIEHLLLPRQLFQRAREALRPGGRLILSTPYHGFFKNLAISLVNGWDAHCHPLRDFGHVKFFSKSTLVQLCREQGLAVTRFHRVGRIPALAKSMMVEGRLEPMP